MKVGYLDASVTVAMGFDETSNSFVSRALRSFDRLYSSSLMEAEFLAVAAQNDVVEDALKFLRPVRFVHPPGRLSQELGAVLGEGDPSPTGLHHLATALYIFPSPREAYFLSLEEEVTSIADALGFKTEFL